MDDLSSLARLAESVQDMTAEQGLVLALKIAAAAVAVKAYGLGGRYAWRALAWLGRGLYAAFTPAPQPPPEPPPPPSELCRAVLASINLSVDGIDWDGQTLVVGKLWVTLDGARTLTALKLGDDSIYNDLTRHERDMVQDAASTLVGRIEAERAERRRATLLGELGATAPLTWRSVESSMDGRPNRRC